MDVLVLGAGVSGLSAAVLLAEAGLSVDVWAADPPESTTSAVAAAVWYPYRAHPHDRVLAWGADSLRAFTELADDPDNGVTMRAGVELLRGTPDPWWHAAVGSVEPCPRADLPAGYDDGWRFTVPVVEMPAYLPWLRARLERAGGRVAQRRVESMDEAAGACPVVVNCTGLGARALVPDPEVYPVRGQVVIVENPGLERFWLDERHPEGVTYVVPRSHDCVLGGTAEEGVWDAAPDPEAAARILARCTAIEPRLAGAAVIAHRAGLRPARPSVRLEAERRRDGGLVVHNYGHGGAGITLSWGCAAEAAGLVGA